MNLKGILATTAICACTLLTPAHADPTLRLSAVSPGPFQVGEDVFYIIEMSNLAGEEVAGFQAFVKYDPAKLEFVSGSYTAAPFGLPIITPIAPVVSGPDASISLASGINQFIGQQPTSNDAILAILRFSAEVVLCKPPVVEFLPHDPPSRLTTDAGDSLKDLVTADVPVPCVPDLTSDQVVNVQDLLIVIQNWGNCISPPACCPGDANGSGVVNVQDLLIVIIGWGQCPT